MPELERGVRLETELDERAGFAPAAAHSFRHGSGVTVDNAARADGAIPVPKWRGPPVHIPLMAIRRPGAALRRALSTELDRGATFLFMPVLFAAGAFIYFALDREPALVEIAASCGALAVPTWLARQRLVLHLALAALLCLVLGMLFAKIETLRAGTKMLGAEISTRLTGRVALIEHMASGRVRLTLDVISTERPRLKYAPDRVRVSARTVPEGLRAGDAVVGIARLLPPSGPTRPGGYDFAFESYFDGIGANGFFFRAPVRVAALPDAEPTGGLAATIENARTALAVRIRTAIDGEAEGEIAAALIAGVRAGIPDSVNEALRRTGLAHVLSISGLHMALVAATIMFGLRAGFAFFAGFASRRPVKKYAAATAMAALAVYLFISGSAVAAERAFIMIGVMLLAVMFDRQALTMRNLAIAAIIIIAVSPHEVAGPSFQMSFAATAALIGAYAAWSERGRNRRSDTANGRAGGARAALRSIGGYAVGLAVTSLVAGGATAIFGAYHFQRVSPLGLAANLAAMPIVSVVVMPFALIGMLLMPFGLDHWAFAVMGKGLTAMIAIADWFSRISPIDVVGMAPESAVIALTLALILMTLPTTWLRVAAVPFLAAGLVLMAARALPDVLISEDGRLVGLRSGDALAVSRTRPNGFTTEDWQRALKTGTVLKPSDGEAAEALEPTAGGRFVCAGDACIARSKDGAMVAYASNRAAARPFCAAAALIIVDDATASDVCTGSEAAVVTKRDLARNGSAAVTFAFNTGKPHAEIVFAFAEPYRPWHAHRAFSREARGLAPYKRRSTVEKEQTAKN